MTAIMVKTCQGKKEKKNINLVLKIQLLIEFQLHLLRICIVIASSSVIIVNTGFGMIATLLVKARKFGNLLRKNKEFEKILLLEEIKLPSI